MDAVAYYEVELSGLGQRFWDEVDEHIAWIEENPDISRLRNSGYRRVNLKIFPISTNTFFTKARGTTNTDVHKLKIRLYTTSLLRAKAIVGFRCASTVRASGAVDPGMRRVRGKSADPPAHGRAVRR
jgi:hypothetical protein